MTIIDQLRAHIDRLLLERPDDLLRIRWAHGTLDYGIDTDGRYVGIPDDVISGIRWNRAGFGVRAEDESVIIGVWYGDEQIYDAAEWMPTVLGSRCAIVSRDEVELLTIAAQDRLMPDEKDSEVTALLARMAEAVGLEHADEPYDPFL